jgi:hypothetical protein
MQISTHVPAGREFFCFLIALLKPSCCRIYEGNRYAVSAVHYWIIFINIGHVTCMTKILACHDELGFGQDRSFEKRYPHLFFVCLFARRIIEPFDL